MPQENDNYTFHLGLTMAGAVSAGCYTAGVMDYLFEALDLWERAKKGEVDGINSEFVPKNNVVIETMGGTSAGGMATVMASLYAIRGKINPVKKVPINPMESYNLLYDSWVHLDDNENGKSFSKLWDTDDLTEKLGSLFNSKVIDAIADKSFQEINETLDFPEHLKDNLPSYISPDLEVLISHTLLRGIPLSVDFKAEIARRRVDSPNHRTFEHYLVSLFKLNKGKEIDEDEYMWLNPYKKKYADKIKLSTIATGAFPVGLAYREFNQNQFSDKYIKSTIKKIVTGDFSSNNQDIKDRIDLKNFPLEYTSMSVDGGAINNEPYREVASILDGKFPKKDSKHRDIGLIMIDPFPDSGYTKKEYKNPKSLLSVAPRIIQALWNQSKVKRKEMFEQYDTDYFQTLIYPSKFYSHDGYKKSIIPDKNPITSASFNAFGGFLDVDFRVHDFFLGRNNARNFLQYFGSFPYEPSDDPMKHNVHPMHADWTPEMVEKFRITSKGSNKIYLPIIPDLNLLLEGVASGEKKYVYDVPDKPKYDPSNLFALRGKIENRFKHVINRAFNDIVEMERNDKDHPISDSLLEEEFKKSFFGKIGSKISGWVISGVSNPVKNGISKFLTKFVIKMILHDLEDRKILKGDDE
jgi:hypothetical protein